MMRQEKLNDDNVFVYVGVWHGLRVAVMVDRPEYAKQLSKDIAKMIREGYSIHRESLSEFRKLSLASADEIDSMRDKINDQKKKKLVPSGR